MPALLQAALAGPIERVDLISAGPPPWLLDEAPLLLDRPATAGLRLMEQVSLGWALPIDGLSVGTSWRTQELRYAQDIGSSSFGWVVGLPTRLLLPVGVRAGARVRVGRVHIEAGALLDTGSNWADPMPDTLRVTPAVGLGMWTDRRDNGARRR